MATYYLLEIHMYVYKYVCKISLICPQSVFKIQRKKFGLDQCIERKQVRCEIKEENVSQLM